MISSHSSVRTIFSHNKLLAVLSSVLHLLHSTSDLLHTLFHRCQHPKISPLRFHKLSPVPTFQTISPLTQSQTKKCVARPLHFVLLPRGFCVCVCVFCLFICVCFCCVLLLLLCCCCLVGVVVVVVCVLGDPLSSPPPTLHNFSFIWLS